MASLYKFFHSLEKAEKQSWAFLEELLLQKIIKMILWFKPAQAQDINIYCPKEKTDVKAILLCHEANWYLVTLISINNFYLLKKMKQADRDRQSPHTEILIFIVILEDRDIQKSKHIQKIYIKWQTKVAYVFIHFDHHQATKMILT